MRFREHVETTASALGRWLIAQAQDALAVGALWLAGLWLAGVPWAPLWALLAALLQFVPNVGTVLALVGPAVAAAVSGGFTRLLYVLVLYAVVVAVDGLVLQPIFMKRTARVPIWASIVAPIVLGLVLGFWGVLLAPPLLAVIYAYRAREKRAAR